jgi:transposase
MMLLPPTGFGRLGHAATGVVVAARHCCVRGSCVAAGAIASVFDMTGRSPDAMVMPPDIEV